MILENIDRKLQAECDRLQERIPYIAENSCYEKDMKKENLSWWTNGFWSGMLWQMYSVTGNQQYRDTAQKTENALDEALEQYDDLYHDVGFMFLHTAVANYRLTGNQKSRSRGLHAANLLAGRFNPAGNFIRAWNEDKTGWMIIDSLMNIPLLYWAGKEINDPRYAYIANKHADTSLNVLQRPDGSCQHIAVFDPMTGEVLEHPAGQGYAEGSSWSRGQAWAVYGFALAYRHTGNQAYLDAAKRTANYFIAQVSMTEYVSLCDFRSPEKPVYVDTTATACAACGLLEIADMVHELEKNFYEENAKRMLLALEGKHCDWNPETDGILQNGTVSYGKTDETHVPIIYGDYFLVEGILRLMKKGFFIW